MSCVLVPKLCPALCTPWTVAHQAPLSVRFPRQGYWSGLPFPPLGNLPNPRIKSVSPVSPAFAGGFFITAPHGKPQIRDFLKSHTIVPSGIH